MKIEFSAIHGIAPLGDASGSTCRIYLAPPRSIDRRINIPMAVKKYRNEVLDGREDAIEAYLVNLTSTLEDSDPQDAFGKVLRQYVTWPQALICEDGKTCGYIMHAIPDLFRERFQGAAGLVEVESTFGFILQDEEWRREKKLPIIDHTARRVISYRLLEALSVLHANEWVVGDISPNNLLIHVDPDDYRKHRILFLDADSFRRRGCVPPIPQAHTPSWIPPECNTGGQNVQNTKTDVYKACLAILRLYHEGKQRTTVIESPSAKAKMTKEIGPRFSKRVMDGLSESPDERPSCIELKRILIEELKAR